MIFGDTLEPLISGDTTYPMLCSNVAFWERSYSLDILLGGLPERRWPVTFLHFSSEDSCLPRSFFPGVSSRVLQTYCRGQRTGTGAICIRSRPNVFNSHMETKLSVMVCRTCAVASSRQYSL